jgi:hypothetical protein
MDRVEKESQKLGKEDAIDRIITTKLKVASYACTTSV